MSYRRRTRMQPSRDSFQRELAQTKQEMIESIRREMPRTREEAERMYHEGRITKTRYVKHGLLAGMKLDLEVREGQEMVIGRWTRRTANIILTESSDGWLEPFYPPFPLQVLRLAEKQAARNGHGKA